MSTPMGGVLCGPCLHYPFEYQPIVEGFVGFLHMWMSCELQLMEQRRGPVLPHGMLEWHFGPWGTVVLLHACRVSECASLAGQPNRLSGSYTYINTQIRYLPAAANIRITSFALRFGRIAVRLCRQYATSTSLSFHLPSVLHRSYTCIYWCMFRALNDYFGGTIAGVLYGSES
jgi:hypothetical protein